MTKKSNQEDNSSKKDKIGTSKISSKKSEKVSSSNLSDNKNTKTSSKSSHIKGKTNSINSSTDNNKDKDLKKLSDKVETNKVISVTVSETKEIKDDIKKSSDKVETNKEISANSSESKAIKDNHKNSQVKEEEVTPNEDPSKVEFKGKKVSRTWKFYTKIISIIVLITTIVLMVWGFGFNGFNYLAYKKVTDEFFENIYLDPGTASTSQFCVTSDIIDDSFRDECETILAKNNSGYDLTSTLPIEEACYPSLDPNEINDLEYADVSWGSSIFEHYDRKEMVFIYYTYEIPTANQRGEEDNNCKTQKYYPEYFSNYVAIYINEDKKIEGVAYSHSGDISMIDESWDFKGNGPDEIEDW